MSKERQYKEEKKSEQYSPTPLTSLSRIQARFKSLSYIQPKTAFIFTHQNTDEKKEETATSSTNLPEEVQAKMENSFGQDFSDVNIHKDSLQAEEIGAKAYTQGADIHFAPGEYQPQSKEGQELIGHELTHVVQQKQSKVGVGETHGKGLTINQDASLEKEADEKGKQAANGYKIQLFQTAQKDGIQMKITGLPDPASSYLPDEPTLLLMMQSATVADRINFISSYFNEVKINWDECDKLGFIKKLENAENKSNSMSKSNVTPIAGVDKNAPKFYHAYLNINKDETKTDEISQDESSTIVAKRLLTGAIKATDVSGDAYLVTQAIMNLRRMNEILIRVLSSYNTSKDTGVSMEKVMTMYRVEGEMGVPNSKDSIDKGIPSGRKAALTSLNLGPINFDISNMTLLFDEAQLGTLADTEIKGLALRVWAVQLAGLDQVGSLDKAGFANWSNLNWKKAGKTTDTTVLAEKRWDNLFNNILLNKINSNTSSSKAIRVTIQNPVNFVQGILSESVMLYQRYEKDNIDLLSVSGQVDKNVASTPEMAYLRYHAGDANLKMIFMSSIIAASKNTDKKYQPLVNKLVASSGLKKVIGAGTPSLSNWPATAEWLKSDPQNFILLAEFIENASMSEWDSWETHRGGLSRFKVLHEYYKTLLN